MSAEKKVGTTPGEGEPSQLFEKGLSVRREVLGAAYVDAALAGSSSFEQEFQTFVTEACWGTIWCDERLQRRDRSLLVLAMTAALGRMDEFRIHAAGALRNGVTEPELAAALKQIGVYCGVPAAVSCLKVLREVLADPELIRELGDKPTHPGASHA